jgi:small-conductance mechanosensitive channel
MSGKVESGQLVTVGPMRNHKLAVGDIVLCKVNGIQYLHLVKAISGDRIQIGNNKGRINGWTSRRNIFGVVTEISS